MGTPATKAAASVVVVSDVADVGSVETGYPCRSVSLRSTFSGRAEPFFGAHYIEYLLEICRGAIVDTAAAAAPAAS